MKLSDAALKIIPDSRGENTLRAHLFGSGFNVEADVPSGESRGRHEAFVLEPEKAVKKFDEIKSEILETDFESQSDLDAFLLALDGTEDKSNLGGNLTLALSLAWARLKAKTEKQELFQYIRSISQLPITNYQLPNPIFNVIEGGVHAQNELEFQEFQVIPAISDTSGISNFSDALGLGREFYYELKSLLEKKFGKENISLGDEAGFSAPFGKNEEALETLAGLIQKNNYPLSIGMDFAASQFFKNGSYILNGKEYAPADLLKFYLKLISDYKIIALEDPFNEEAFDDFGRLNAEFERGSLETYLRGAGNLKTAENVKHQKPTPPLLIADDLTVTNNARLKLAIETRAAGALIIKPNQAGTLTETLEVARTASEHGWKTVVSHRSGETMDDFIADLAVGINAWGIKAGAPAKPERLVKYERIIKILR
ncbi:phosphopyruvate hydratase [Candidatus Wolfebacteria bacterium]|nr:phosphopyruvate hydratase [Candidatus Wolfebacteria bacterium]